MGMFDSIQIRWRGLEKIHPERIFQTKDLDCKLDLYVVKEDGRLYKDNELIEYSGPLTFYDVYAVEKDINYHRVGWVQFQAEFIDGTILSISLTKLDKGNMWTKLYSDPHTL